MIAFLSQPMVVFTMGLFFGLFCGFVVTALLAANTREESFKEQNEKIAALQADLSRITEAYKEKTKELEEERE